MCECTFLYKAAILDSVTWEDWGEEIFAEGVGVKWNKWEGGGGGEEKNTALFFHLPTAPRLCTNPLPVKQQLQSKMKA